METNNTFDKELSDELEKIGYSYHSLSKKDKEYIQKIKICCDKIIENEIMSKKDLSRKYISVKNVSKLSKIARQTFYNQPILQEYVNFKEKEFNKIDASYQINILQKENSELKKRINQMIKRDIEIIELRNKEEEYKEIISKKNALLEAYLSGKIS